MLDSGSDVGNGRKEVEHMHSKPKKRHRRMTSIPHVHRHDDITVELVDRFADASREEQLAALTALRVAAANDDQTSIFGLSSIVVSVFLVCVSPLLIPTQSPPDSPLARFVLGFVMLGVLLVLISPTVLGIAKDLKRRERARAWLGAYETELQRRWALRGRSALRWQRMH